MTTADLATIDGRAVRPIPRSSPRARPLPPDERRAALIASTLPLLLEYGMNVSTRMIAEASGVAEGTIFRVFPDKETLIRATIDAALNPRPLLDQLADVAPVGDLHSTLETIVALFQQRLIKVFRLFSALEIARPPRTDPPHEDVNAIISARVAELLESHSDELCYSPAEAARMLRIVIFAGSHPAMTEGKILTPAEIVALVLDGIARREGPAA